MYRSEIDVALDGDFFDRPKRRVTPRMREASQLRRRLGSSFTAVEDSTPTVGLSCPPAWGSRAAQSVSLGLDAKCAYGPKTSQAGTLEVFLSKISFKKSIARGTLRCTR